MRPDVVDEPGECDSGVALRRVEEGRWRFPPDDRDARVRIAGAQAGQDLGEQPLDCRAIGVPGQAAGEDERARHDLSIGGEQAEEFEVHAVRDDLGMDRRHVGAKPLAVQFGNGQVIRNHGAHRVSSASSRRAWSCSSRRSGQDRSSWARRAII